KRDAEDRRPRLLVDDLDRARGNDGRADPLLRGGRVQGDAPGRAVQLFHAERSSASRSLEIAPPRACSPPMTSRCHASVSRAVSISGRNVSPAVIAFDESNVEKPPDSGSLDGSHTGSSVHGCTPSPRRNSSSTHT